ncbi:MAG: exonuclease domain-containing protein [Chloroflexi bacterium]|nr:exonuclease domain-containing protein [Chloroflexota bacterium]
MKNPKSIACLDLETTGLSPERDSVIEIGAVLFRGERVEDEWSTLVNPGHPIPRAITDLTGITDAMVAEAPRLDRALAILEPLVGDRPILGQSIGFDLGFLQRHGLFKFNPAYDTYDLAAVLLPTAPRYNLGALASTLGVILPATHRALDDARATRAVFLRLLELAAELPLDLVAELVRLSQNLEWGGGQPLEDVLGERLREGEAVGPLAAPALFNLPALRPSEAPDLSPASEPSPLNIDEVVATLDDGGALAARFPGYERRTQQLEMTAAVARALSDGRHLLVEAGTGTGKSLAYLVPAVHWAVRNGCRVVVSTNTINLQDQLIHKDVPDLRAALNLDFRAAVLKGRANYLCPRKLEVARRRGPETTEEMRVLGKTLVWLRQTTTGDRGELNLGGPAERMAWDRLSAQDEPCTLETCQTLGHGMCPFYRARVAAESAHVLIVNHSLLVADIAAENRVLPEYDYLIVDEAHHLEGAATDGLAFHLTQPDFDRVLRELGGSRGGLLGALTTLTRRPPAWAGELDLRALLDRLAEGGERCQSDGRALFETLRRFIEIQLEAPIGEYGLDYRLLPSTRSLPGWEEVEIAWENLRGALDEVRRITSALGDRLTGAGGGSTEGDDLASDMLGWARRVQTLMSQMNQVFAEPSSSIINWVGIQSERLTLSLHAAPLHVGPLVERHLWHQKTAIIMTSATLTAAGEFDYLIHRLNADEADTLVVGSPFDYEHSALVYLVSDIPEPSDARGYQRGVEQGLIALCKASRGRALVLFTSYAQLRQTHQAIAAPLARAGVTVFEQGEGASRHSLLESFRASDQAVLLGTRSFWEGVDVPGQALSVVAIVRLPFAVPSDPIVAARSETFDDSFSEYSLPEAILRFRQGFGRLIRTRTDRGLAVVFDRRILTKSYGRYFTNSLPDCKIEQGTLRDLPQRAQLWLGE